MQIKVIAQKQIANLKFLNTKKCLRFGICLWEESPSAIWSIWSAEQLLTATAPINRGRESATETIKANMSKDVFAKGEKFAYGGNLSVTTEVG